MQNAHPDNPSELDTLIDAVIEGAATHADYARLDTLLDGDTTAQSHYLRRVDLHNTLRWTIESEATRRAIGELRAAGVGPDGVTRDDAAHGPVATIGRFAWVVGLAAMIAFGALIAVNVTSIPTPSPDDAGDGGGPIVATTQTRAPTPGTTRPDASPQATQTTPPTPATQPAQPDGPRIIDDAVATLREATGVIITADQTALRRNDPIGIEALTLAADARAVVAFDDGATLRVQGPTELAIRGAHHAELIRGRVVLSTTHTPGGFKLDAPGATFTDAGTELGVDVDATGRLRASVFRGEIKADVADRYVGITQHVTLTRDDGLDIAPDGYITTAIIADAGRFAALREPTSSRAPTIANASFEYPHTDHAQLAASGWTLMSHPVANAVGMHVNAGVIGAERAAVDVAGTTPTPPNGEQWAYLNAKTFEDGRLAHASMHQAVGEIAEDVTYRLSLTVGRLAHADRLHGSLYTVGLYTGSLESGPRLPLQVWRDPVMPPPGGASTATMTFHSPLHTPFRGQTLFIVIEAVPGAKPGMRQVLIDDVKLDIVNDRDVARAPATPATRSPLR
ncbi:MAG: hypothetical protein GC159_22955 [Phycisphaera sp.]|nr:hypothetical protein [Phycisphaera sp.]